MSKHNLFVVFIHLGHELHQLETLEHDAKVKRAIFIQNSTDIREVFEFAHPAQVLQAVNVYASHFYGAMLWNLYGDGASQVFRSWNTCVKLAWGIPRWSHNYLVEHVLSSGIPSVRQKILGQYLGFFQKLVSSPSPEISLLANLVARDAGSVTAKNLSNIENEFELDPWVSSSAQLREKYTFYRVPEEDKWRAPLLVKLLDQKNEMTTMKENTKTISEVIDSLCCS